MLCHDFDRSFGQIQGHCKKKCKLRFLFKSLKTLETFKVLTSKIAYELRMCYEPRVSCARSLFKKKVLFLSRPFLVQSLHAHL